jgi:hypothetical protein
MLAKGKGQEAMKTDMGRGFVLPGCGCDNTVTYLEAARDWRRTSNAENADLFCAARKS